MTIAASPLWEPHIGLSRLVDELAAARPTWMARAACIDPPDDADFFPGPGGDAEAAKAICAECSVRAACLAFAMEDPKTVGVWGGTATGERHILRRARARRA